MEWTFAIHPFQSKEDLEKIAMQKEAQLQTLQNK